LFAFSLENLQGKQPLGVFVQDLFFDLFGQHRVIAQMLKIPWELAIPVRDIRRKEKMIRADVFDGLRQCDSPGSVLTIQRGRASFFVKGPEGPGWAQEFARLKSIGVPGTNTGKIARISKRCKFSKRRKVKRSCGRVDYLPLPNKSSNHFW
jgi:hypothetical protein